MTDEHIMHNVIKEAVQPFTGMILKRNCNAHRLLDSLIILSFHGI
jgi:hypothetical protein